MQIDLKRVNNCMTDCLCYKRCDTRVKKIVSFVQLPHCYIFTVSKLFVN